MAKAKRVHSTSPTNTPISHVDATSGRRFLSNAAGIAAGGTALVLATVPPASALAALAGALDPVFGLIEAHRAAFAAYLVALEEHHRLDRLGDPAAYLISEAPFMAQLDVLNDLVGTAPSTFAGLQAWAGYLAEIRHCDESWVFEEDAPALVVTLVEALGNLAEGCAHG
jgi:hypothetical protein